MFQPGDTIGSYLLVKRIGEGAFGDVWLAEKTGLVKTRFALKLPKGNDIDTQVFGEEAEVWARVSGHTNVVPIIEADTHPVKRNGIDISHEQIVIVSEYLPDGSLQTQLNQNRGKAPTAERAAEIVLGILSGLNYLHTRNPAIIHRDLKPDNVLLQGETPRLTDFGISRALKTASYLQTQRIAGTMPYMAPEAFDGHFSPRTDIWAAGVVLYQLLGGTLPFPQREMPSLIAAILNDEPPPLPDSVPRRFHYVVSRALEKSPERRYATADEMRRDLLDALHGREIAAPTLPSPSPREIRKPGNAPAHFVPFNPQEVRESSPRPHLFKWIAVAVAALVIAGIGFVFWIGRPTAQANDTAATEQPAATVKPTDSVTPEPSASVAASQDPANGHLVAFGITKPDTQTEPLLFRKNGNLSVWNRETQTKTGPTAVVRFITEWFVKRGQIEKCKSGRDVASYTLSPTGYLDEDGVIINGLVGMPGPFVVDSIDVEAKTAVGDGQKVGTLSYINHILVTANVSPENAAAISVNSKAVFSEPNSKKSFNGVVYVVNKQTGEVGIRLNDEEIFDEKRCLYVNPNTNGEVTFDINNGQR